MAHAAPKRRACHNIAAISGYTVVDAYKQDSTILHLFTYFPHSLCFISPFKSTMAHAAQKRHASHNLASCLLSSGRLA